jgi:hypothetical protein
MYSISVLYYRAIGRWTLDVGRMGWSFVVRTAPWSTPITTGRTRTVHTHGIGHPHDGRWEGAIHVI